MNEIELQAFLAEARIERVVLEAWVERRWIVPADAAAPLALDAADAARACLIRDLSGDFGVNDAGIDVALHLIDQLHDLRRVLDALRAGLDASAADDRG